MRALPKAVETYTLPARFQCLRRAIGTSDSAHALRAFLERGVGIQGRWQGSIADGT